MNKQILLKCVEKLKELTTRKKRDPDLMYVLGMLETLMADNGSTPLGVQNSGHGPENKEPFIPPQPPVVPKDAIGLATLANPNDKTSLWKNSLPPTKSNK